MKVGDLVKSKDGFGYGVIVRVDDSHRQKTLDILFKSGIKSPVWVNYVEAVSTLHG